MRPAELFLRVGCALVGWLAAFAHLLLLAVIPQVECVPGANDPWLVATITAGPALFAVVLLRTAPFLDETLRWLGLPLLLLAWPALRATLGAFDTATLGGASLCPVSSWPDETAPVWQRAWAPGQLLLLVLLLLSAASLFTRSRGNQKEIS